MNALRASLLAAERELNIAARLLAGGESSPLVIEIERARAIVLEPNFIVLDEPTSALDMSVQAQIVDLLRELQARHRLAYLFISHDLAVIDLVCDHVVVLQAGRIVEQGDPDTLFSNPQHPYTQRLLAAVPGAQAARSVGWVPSPTPSPTPMSLAQNAAHGHAGSDRAL